MCVSARYVSGQARWAQNSDASLTVCNAACIEDLVSVCYAWQWLTTTRKEKSMSGVILYPNVDTKI